MACRTLFVAVVVIGSFGPVSADAQQPTAYTVWLQTSNGSRIKAEVALDTSDLSIRSRDVTLSFPYGHTTAKYERLYSSFCDTWGRPDCVIVGVARSFRRFFNIVDPIDHWLELTAAPVDRHCRLQLNKDSYETFIAQLKLKGIVVASQTEHIS